MKKLLCNAKTIVILLLVAVISLGFLTVLASRPISYGLGYNNKTEYDGGEFVGRLEFQKDGTLINKNSNFEEELVSRYYFKDGYVFFLAAQTEEEAEIEIADINERFDELKDAPFYADEINAFRMVASESDGYKTVYSCTAAVALAIALSALSLASLGLAVVSVVLKKKENK